VVLRLRIKICSGENCVETTGLANTGFAGRDPEVVLPQELVVQLLGREPSTLLVERVLADGSRVFLPRTTKPLDLYVVTSDRVEGPVKVYAYITRSRVVLINDSALSALRVVIIDPRDGLWCFRDELGVRERRGV
jgi:hypothetical protein